MNINNDEPTMAKRELESTKPVVGYSSWRDSVIAMARLPMHVLCSTYVAWLPFDKGEWFVRV